MGLLEFNLSIPYLNEAIAYPGIKPSEKLVLLILANHADEKGYCWPSQKTICRETCLSESAVKRAIRELEFIGLLQVTRAHRVSNGYQIKFLGVKLDPRVHKEPSRGSKQQNKGFTMTSQPSGRTITQPDSLKENSKWEISEETKKLIEECKNSLKEDSVSYKVSVSA